ncbi:Ribonuclease H2 subunit B [Pseudolycoriella hygida]|uniref:Ribonuclease H2 subunit B n=1 Tax=Pseudolycoriella hygida TaxID=35572 RepID=A0A9Q0MHS6_9DIPT|nr:Ribonuclease H2 subunit B [Pseudolycoriella hygida]
MDSIPESKVPRCAESHRVFFLNDYVARNGMQLFGFRNPSTGAPSKYIFHEKSNEFFELLKFNEPFRSWFVGDIITDDGGIYLCPPIDPLFLLLHYVQSQASEKYVPLEHILVDENYPNMTTIADAVTTDQLLLIADQKGDPQLKAVRYNKEKTLDWLAYKCKLLQDALRQRKLNLESGAKSSTFVASSKINDQDDDDIQLLAFEILNDYLSKQLSDSLSEYLHLDAIKSKKRKQNSEAAMNPKSKKIKMSIDDEDVENPTPTPVVAEKKVSAKAKQLAKSAKGSKNIMSFFKVK